MSLNFVFLLHTVTSNAITIAVVLLALYLLVGGVFIFIRKKEVSENFKSQFSLSQFLSKDVGPDRGILLDDPLDAGLARLKIIEDAKETLDIAYFAIQSGEAPNLFFGALIDAADRGVQVNLLLDGLFHGLRGPLKAVRYIFARHDNMTLKFFEPLNLLKPWTLNNRMHDKYIIADKKIAIIGGRNIGDKYFAPDWYTARITNDRDIIVINTRNGDPKSVVPEMSCYFDTIWHHPLSKPTCENLASIHAEIAEDKTRELKQKSQKARSVNQSLFDKPVDLMAVSFPIRKASFIHNPLGRHVKEPWCWYQITQLMRSAKQSIFVQSPYIIANKHMVQGFLEPDDFLGIDITALTNSLRSTPNLLAFSGYQNHRKQLVDHGLRLYEYQSRDSLHTKAFIIDDFLLALGSFNSDPRSTFLNTESMLVIHSPEAVKKIEEGLERYFVDSLLVGEDYRYQMENDCPVLPVHPVKKVLVTMLSKLLAPFEFFL